jgi:hypothetical protein
MKVFSTTDGKGIDLTWRRGAGRLLRHREKPLTAWMDGGATNKGNSLHSSRTTATTRGLRTCVLTVGLVLVLRRIHHKYFIFWLLLFSCIFWIYSTINEAKAGCAYAICFLTTLTTNAIGVTSTKFFAWGT